MKRTFLGRYRRYFVMAFLILFTLLTISRFYRDTLGSTETMMEDSLSESAKIFTLYFDDMIGSHFAGLAQMADTIADKVQNNAKETREALDGSSDLFQDLIIYDRTGKKIFGDDIGVTLDPDDVERIVDDKKEYIYPEVVQSGSGKESIILCEPIHYPYGGNVVGILCGTVALEEIQKFFDQWGGEGQNCIFLMQRKGLFVTGSSNYRENITENFNNYFSYLSDCEIANPDFNTEELENRLGKGETSSFSYAMEGKSYVTVLTPSQYPDWFLGYIENIKNFKRVGIEINVGTVVSAVVCLVLWILWIAYFVRFGYRYNRLAESVDRYDEIRRMEGSVMFEFQFSPKRLSFFGDCEGIFGVKQRTLLGEEVYDIYQYVHEEDVSVRGRIHQFYDDDKEKFTTEIRLKNADGEFSWFRITALLIKDKEYGTNLRFLGKIENANQQIADKKNLVQRAEYDLLTGILNKKTMEEKVSKALEHITGNYRYIFFMVDLDNFKNVNDQLGHIMGDRAIVDTAHLLTAVFPRNAYVGRLGGDEFAVCVAYDAFDEESLYDFIRRKAEKVCEVNRRIYSNVDQEIRISSSVGIAVAPDHAKDFQTLYKKADSALYLSKNGGKNCYHIYS